MSRVLLVASRAITVLVVVAGAASPLTLGILGATVSAQGSCTGPTTWAALVSAFANAPNGTTTTVMLCANITASTADSQPGYLSIGTSGSSTASVVLDLNAYSLNISAPYNWGGAGVAAIYVPTGTSLTIQDSNDTNGTGVLTTTGGGSNYDSEGAGAGIGGNADDSSGSITIAGGSVNATGATGVDGGGSAGIGGGSGDAGSSGGAGTVTITGGTVTATGATGSYGGGGGAGIGGGGSGPMEGYGGNATVTIKGGTVTSNGGAGSTGFEDGTGGAGADIGGGGGDTANGTAILTLVPIITVSPASPQLYGTPVTVTATLPVQSGMAAATGTITFNGTTTCGTKSVSSNAASCTYDNPPIGNDSLNVAYSGDGNYQAATSDSTYIVTPPNVASFTNVVNGQEDDLTTPSGTTVTCGASENENVTATPDSGYSYPLGMVNFCFTTSQTNNPVTLVFTTSLTPSQVVARKYNTNTHTWTNVPGATVTGTIYDGQPALQLSYTIVDNGPLDEDPTVGYIQDPIGLAQPVNASTLTDTGENITLVTTLAAIFIATAISVRMLHSREVTRGSV